MKISDCEFPDGVLYEPEGFVWVRLEAATEAILGITSIQAALAGRLTKVTAKPLNEEYPRGRSIGLLESGKYFGAIRTPLDSVLIEVNEAVLAEPKLLSEDPYRKGWFARLRTKSDPTESGMKSASDLRDVLASQITALRVHCFAAFPDYEMFEIGTECAAVLVKLDELIERARLGEVVHLVSDDWTAPVEMENWSMRTGHAVVESRKEGNLFHFLVRKSH